MTAPLVANAADAKQVKHARRKEATRVEREIAEMRAVLATAEGRGVFWRLLGRLGYGIGLDTIAQPERELNAGKQAAMWLVLADITAADEESLIKMMRESRASDQREAAEAQAVRTSTQGESE